MQKINVDLDISFKMFAFLKYFVFLAFVIEEFYFNISFPQRYQWVKLIGSTRVYTGAT